MPGKQLATGIFGPIWLNIMPTVKMTPHLYRFFPVYRILFCGMEKGQLVFVIVVRNKNERTPVKANVRGAYIDGRMVYGCGKFSQPGLAKTMGARKGSKQEKEPLVHAGQIWSVKGKSKFIAMGPKYWNF